MLLTEEEAMKKACYQWVQERIRNYEFKEVSYETIITKCKCATSSCMAWRWNKESKRRFNDTEGKCKWEDVPQVEWKGYCGLAGKPE